MKLVLRWTYILLLIFPVSWVLTSYSWYYWTKNTFGSIPYNDFLYGIKGSTANGAILDLFEDLGEITLMGFILSFFLYLGVIVCHLIAIKFLKNKELTMHWKSEGIPSLIILLIFMLNFIPVYGHVFHKFLNYLFD